MNERPCIRCQHPVLLEDGHLSYCSYCGVPQIFLSEDLQAEIARETREFTERTTPAVPTPDGSAADSPATRPPANRRPGQVLQPWTEAVQYALLSAAVAMALGLLTLFVPAASILMLLWVVAAPILTVAIYNARTASPVPPDSGFAARLGLLTGLLVVVVCATIVTLELVLARYVLHNAAPLDTQLSAAFDQQRAVLLQRFGNDAQPTLNMFTIPEFRVGLLLSTLSMSAALYLLLSATAAGLAGAVLGRRRSA